MRAYEVGGTVHIAGHAVELTAVAFGTRRNRPVVDARVVVGVDEHGVEYFEAQLVDVRDGCVLTSERRPK